MKKKRPHILYITNGSMFRQTGFSQQCRAEISELAKRGYPMTALAYENHAEFRVHREGRRSLAEQVQDAGARLVTIPVFMEHRPRMAVLRAWLDGGVMAALAQSLRADILHVHEIHAAALACRVGRLLHKPVVVDMHGVPLAEALYAGAMQKSDPAYRRMARAERQATLQADLLFVVSSPFQRYLSDTYGIQEERTRITRSSVDIRQFRFDPAARSALRRELGVGDQPLLMFVGSIQAYQIVEQVAAFVQAAREVRPDTFFLCLSPDAATTESALQNAGLTANLAIRSVPHADVPRWLSAADAGLLLREPSLVNAVASPVKIAEYLACGLPCAISAGIGDLSDMVAEGDLGVRVESLDTACYTDAARTLFADWPDGAPARRARCRAFAEKELSWERCMAVFEESYRHLAPHTFTGGQH